MFRQQKPRHAHTIYRTSESEWALTRYTRDVSSDDPEHGWLVTMTIGAGGSAKIDTTRIRSFRTLRHKLNRFPAKIGPYNGKSPKPNIAFEEQPRAVRMQRHAWDLYDTLGRARGLSESRAIVAAQTFGSTWRDKDSVSDWQRVDGIGAGRAEKIVAEGERVGLW